MVVGIVYHSPLDVVSLLPTNVTYSLSPEDSVDILISDRIIDKYKAKIQIVFASARVLFKANLLILDQGPWGKIITLTNSLMEDLVKKTAVDNTPDWVKFRIK